MISNHRETWHQPRSIRDGHADCGLGGIVPARRRANARDVGDGHVEDDGGEEADEQSFPHGDRDQGVAVPVVVREPLMERGFYQPLSSV